MDEREFRLDCLKLANDYSKELSHLDAYSIIELSDIFFNYTITGNIPKRKVGISGGRTIEIDKE